MQLFASVVGATISGHKSVFRTFLVAFRVLSVVLLLWQNPGHTTLSHKPRAEGRWKGAAHNNNSHLPLTRISTIQKNKCICVSTGLQAHHHPPHQSIWVEGSTKLTGSGGSAISQGFSVTLGVVSPEVVAAQLVEEGKCMGSLEGSFDAPPRHWPEFRGYKIGHCHLR